MKHVEIQRISSIEFKVQTLGNKRGFSLNSGSIFASCCFLTWYLSFLKYFVFLNIKWGFSYLPYTTALRIKLDDSVKSETRQWNYM